MVKKIVAFASTEDEVRRKIEIELNGKYLNYSIIELKIHGPSTTSGGGIQYTGECVFKVESYF
jgi:hypothetical protein